VIRATYLSSLLMIVAAYPAIAADIDKPIIAGSSFSSYDNAADTADMLEPSGSGFSGYIEGSVSKAFDTPYDVDGHAWALRGSINIEGPSGLNIQFDGGFARTTVENVGVNQLVGAGHAYYRDREFAAGGFVQASSIDADYLGYGLNDTIKDYLGGVEGAWFMDQATIYGRAGYGQAKWEGYSADHAMGAIGARLYATDNFRFDVEGAINRLSHADLKLDTRSATFSVNYRPESVPITVFSGYRFDQIEPSMSGASLGHANVSTIFAGLRFSFGSNSLKDEERNGPVWTASSLLP